VLQLEFPTNDIQQRAFLAQRGASHFNGISPKVLEEAATQLVKDRAYCQDKRQYPLPGQAEYLDLLRAVTRQFPDAPIEQEKLLKRIAGFTFRKYPGAQE
jgi:hypothetical protein